MARIEVAAALSLERTWADGLNRTCACERNGQCLETKLNEHRPAPLQAAAAS